MAISLSIAVVGILAFVVGLLVPHPTCACVTPRAELPTARQLKRWRAERLVSNRGNQWRES